MKKYCRIFITILLINIAGLSLAFAQSTHYLFTEGRINSYYDVIVKEIQSGDILSFSDGARFTVENILGQGGTTLVVSIKEDPTKALRIPLRKDTLSYIRSYVRGHRAIEEAHVPALKIYEPSNKEYVLVEKISGSFVSFRDFVAMASKTGKQGWLGRILGQKPTAEMLEIKEMSTEFREFAGKLFSFAIVGDMHQDNLIFDQSKRKWILMDWIGSHENALYIENNKIQYKDLNPLLSLVHKYGYFQKGKFFVLDSYYSWLIPLVDSATNEIKSMRTQRIGRLINAPLCAHAFL